jgi:hypothetical protein
MYIRQLKSVDVLLHVFPRRQTRSAHNKNASLNHARRVLPLLPRTKMRAHSTLWDSAGVCGWCVSWIKG